MEKLTYKNLSDFTREYDLSVPTIPFYGKLRFGQAACNYFSLPKELEAKIYYSDDRTYVESELWMTATPD